MMANKVGKYSQLSVVSFDPRTKLYALLIFNIVMLTSLTEGVSVYLKPFLAILAFLFLLNARMTKTAVIYLVLYVVSWNAEFFLQYISGMSLGGFLIRFFSHMITRIYVCVLYAQNNTGKRIYCGYETNAHQSEIDHSRLRHVSLFPNRRR